jgi:hypothetical protein
VGGTSSKALFAPIQGVVTYSSKALLPPSTRRIFFRLEHFSPGFPPFRRKNGVPEMPVLVPDLSYPIAA